MVRLGTDPGQMLLTDQVDESTAARVEDVERVASILAIHGQSTAAEICQRLGWIVNENNKRKVRAVAEASRPGIVSFPNSAGYKLLKQCTLPEMQACISAWGSVRQRAGQVEAIYLRAIHALGWTP